MEVKAIRSDKLSKAFQDRYILVDIETGEIIDDAQGYGYKSKQKAYACWGYKTRDKSKDKEKAKRRNQIKQWLKNNPNFVEDLEIEAFNIIKGSGDPNDKINANLVRRILDRNKIETEFRPGEILKVWQYE